MMRERGGRQSGAGTVEYVGMVVLAAVLFAGLLVVFPSSGEQLACKVSQAIGSITGDPVSCHSGGSGKDADDDEGVAEAPDSPTFSVVPGATASGTRPSGTSRVEFDVDVPEGENWTVQSDQPWLTVPDGRVFDGPTFLPYAGPYGGGNGPGSLTATVHANPNPDGEPRTATLTFTGPDGETFTQEITQEGGTANTVVLGDSFSAGNGALKGNVDGGVDDGCHRSSMSWGRQLEAGTSNDAGTPSVSLGAFGACSGATVNGTSLTGETGSSALLDQIAANSDALGQADQVAFSIGGNDMGFEAVVSDCVAPGGPVRIAGLGSTVASCHDAVEAGRERINSEEMGSLLKEAYQAMLDAAPNATIYVVGYPPMVELDDTGGGFLDYGEVEPENYQEIVDMIHDLNYQIGSSVNLVNMSNPDGARLVFVDPTKPGSGFEGHSLTDDVPYYEGLDVDWKFDVWNSSVEPWSYHPNVAGNEEYARWIGWHMMGNR